VLLHWELAGHVDTLALLDAVAGLHLAKCELYLALPGSRHVCFPSQATQINHLHQFGVGFTVWLAAAKHNLPPGMRTVEAVREYGT
jgi:hypothetical protein